MEKQIEIYSGCMASGKSKAIIRRAGELDKKGLAVVCLKPDFEVRDNGIESREGVQRDALSVQSLGKAALEQEVEQSNVVVIDEVFFFNGELLDDTVDTIANWQNNGKWVIAATLDYSAMGERMTVYQALMERLDVLEVPCLEAMCSYEENHSTITPANRTQIINRLNGEPIREGLPELVPEDPANPLDYKAVCSDCFYAE